MKIINIISIISLSSFLACNNAAVKNSNNINSDTSKVLVKSPPVHSKIKKQDAASENELRPSDCVRGTPEPIVIKSVFPKTTFHLLKDSLTAFETVEFDNRDKLIIKNWGCESYCLTFRFETKRFHQDITNTKFWFSKAIQLIKETEKGIDEGAAEIGVAVDSLSRYVKRTTKPKLGHSLKYGSNGFGNFVTINRIQKLTEDTYAIELTFSVGLIFE